jgi:hypothetical protein
MSRLSLACLFAACLLLQAQSPFPEPRTPDLGPDTSTLPNGKSRAEAILKSDQEKSLADAKELVTICTALEKDLEAQGAQDVLSIVDIHRTEDIEKLAKRIRGRIRR